MSDARSAALEYAVVQGWKVFPCDGKKPVVPWKTAATTDLEQIRQWFQDGSSYNIAVATGGGLVVLDVDAHGADGKGTLSALEAQHSPLPDTVQCLTGGGGVHYYFRSADPTLTIGAGIAPGLDFRASGGYIIVPPSAHPETGVLYEWAAGHGPSECQVAELPEWLHEMMAKKKPQQNAPATRFEMPKEIPEGQRTDSLFRLLSSLQAKGLTDEAIKAAVRAENELKCFPPLTESELETEVFPALRRYQKGTAPYIQIGTSISLKPPDFSDAGNSVVFTQRYNGELIYTNALGWLQWDGTRWDRSEHIAVALALNLSEAMLQDALNTYKNAQLALAEAEVRAEENETQEEKDGVTAAKSAVKAAKEYLGHAKASRSATKIKSMVELSKPALAIKAELLDANPFDLNTPAGIVDLRTGAIRPHDKAAYCTQITEVSPVPTGQDTWASFLEDVTCGDQSISDYLQKCIGLSLLGKVFHEGIFLAYGSGRNGKSTLFNCIGHCLGSYTGGIDVKTLTTDRGNKGASLATLRGKRFVITGELEEHQRLSVATLKQLASTDKITIEEKFKQPETVVPSHTLILFTNFLPRVGSTDTGTWRRLTVIPFEATFEGKQCVLNYADILVETAGGAILSWAIEGAVQIIKDNFKLELPDSVKQSTESYREREDWLANFINERCIRGPDNRVSASVLYQHYREWALTSGEYVRRLNDFTAAMKTAGYKNIKPGNRSTWLGLNVSYDGNTETPRAVTGF